MSIISRQQAHAAPPADELRLVAHVLDVLNRERELLESGDAGQLTDLIPARERAVQDLRERLWNRANDAAPRHPALLAMLTRVANLNAANGRYSDIRLNYVRARLAGLAQAAGSAAWSSAALYHRDGLARGSLYGTP